jgi:hypothetical protein
MSRRSKCQETPTPVNESLTTNWFQFQATAIGRAIGRGACIKVIIRNPLTTPAGAPNPLEVRVGDATGQHYDLLPGANTPEIYAEDLKDIYVKALTDPTDITIMVYSQYRPEVEQL